MNSGEFLTSHQSVDYINSLTNRKVSLYQSSQINGHGGGDEVLISDFITLIEKKKNNEVVEVATSSSISMVSHLMAFAADEARIHNKIIEFSNF